MTNKLLTAAKDKAAQELNFDSFNIAIRYTFGRELLPSEKEFIQQLSNRAMEIYAEVERTEGIREGFEAARESKANEIGWPSGDLYPTVDDYLKSRE